MNLNWQERYPYGDGFSSSSTTDIFYTHVPKMGLVEIEQNKLHFRQQKTGLLLGEEDIFSLTEGDYFTWLKNTPLRKWDAELKNLYKPDSKLCWFERLNLDKDDFILSHFTGGETFLNCHLLKLNEVEVDAIMHLWEIHKWVQEQLVPYLKELIETISLENKTDTKLIVSTRGEEQLSAYHKLFAVVYDPNSKWEGPSWNRQQKHLDVHDINDKNENTVRKWIENALLEG